MALLILAGAALVAGLAALRLYGPAAEDTYRVDAVFDTAKGTVAGQYVRIAGANVGTIEDVSLTGDNRARIEMQIDERFAPFRSDATCSIQPAGLISENFVQCNPGTPEGEPLRGRGDSPPTVPVDRTGAPVSISDLFEIWSVPTRQRFSLVLNTIGAGFAARGDDINEIIRRAVPTLALTRRALDIINRDRGRIASIATAADRVFGELANRDQRVGAFIGRAARVSTRVGSQRGALAEATRRLPALLRAARPALARVDELARDGAPILADLRQAAPDLNRLVTDAEPFAEAARPVVRRLNRAAHRGLRAARFATPVVAELRTFARRATPAGKLLDQLFASLRDRGFVENLLDVTYNLGAAAARFDGASHLIPGLLNITVSSCTLPLQVRTQLCSAGWDPNPSAARAQPPLRSTIAPTSAPPPTREEEGSEAASPVPDARAPEPAAPAAGEPAPTPVAPHGNPVTDLLDFLFGP